MDQGSMEPVPFLMDPIHKKVERTRGPRHKLQGAREARGVGLCDTPKDMITELGTKHCRKMLGAV